MKTMNTHWHSTKLVALTSLLVGALTLPVRAQPLVNTTVNAVGGVTGGLGGVGSSAGSGFGGSLGGPGAAAGGSVGGAIGAPPLHQDVVASGAFESIGARQERLAMQTEVAPRHIATGALSAGMSAESIRAASVDSRSQLATDIDERIAASSKAMAAMRVEAKSLRGDAQADFKAAAKDVDVREKDLRTSVKVARKASAETWAESRAKVAANYEAYAQAVGRAETVAAAGRASTTASTAASVTARTK